MELCCTDLHSVLYHNDFPLLPSVIKRLLTDLLKGVHAMHSHGALRQHFTEYKDAAAETCVCFSAMPCDGSLPRRVQI